MNLTRKILQKELKKNGFNNIQTASSGIEALRLLEWDKFDLILTDLCMPGMDGVELIERIREMPQYSVTPIIVVSADSDFQSVSSAFKIGATGYVNKPFRPAALIGQVRRNLGLPQIDYLKDFKGGSSAS